LKGLKKNTRLTSLLLDANPLASEGISHIAHAIASHPSLRVLSLGHTQADEKAAVELANALVHNTSLTSLAFSQNRMPSEGFVQFVNILKKNSSLQVLRLSSCNITESGAKVISEMIKVHPQLCNLDLQWNYIGDEGVKAIGDALPFTTSLHTLLLNAFSNSLNLIFSIEKIVEGMKRNKSLTHFEMSISGIKCGYEEISRLSQLVSKSTQLTRVNIERLWENYHSKDGKRHFVDDICEILENRRLVSLNISSLVRKMNEGQFSRFIEKLERHQRIVDLGSIVLRDDKKEERIKKVIKRNKQFWWMKLKEGRVLVFLGRVIFLGGLFECVLPVEILYHIVVVVGGNRLDVRERKRAIEFAQDGNKTSEDEFLEHVFGPWARYVNSKVY